ncbi:MAG: SET domain-containing protein-lysine N-methyltransferase [Patescibacteria group bacterium]
MNYKKLLFQIDKKPRVHGYVSSFTKTKLSSIHGLGLFAKRSIKKDTVVAVWGGRVTTKNEVEQLPKDIAYNYALKLYPGFYLAETSLSELDSSDFINHSCAPNCKIVNKFVMITDKDIPQGQELTADFFNHKNKGQKFICNCKAKNCKKTVYYD